MLTMSLPPKLINTDQESDFLMNTDKTIETPQSPPALAPSAIGRKDYLSLRVYLTRTSFFIQKWSLLALFYLVVRIDISIITMKNTRSFYNSVDKDLPLVPKWHKTGVMMKST
jgi:hypothetical protein